MIPYVKKIRRDEHRVPGLDLRFLFLMFMVL